MKPYLTVIAALFLFSCNQRENQDNKADNSIATKGADSTIVVEHNHGGPNDVQSDYANNDSVGTDISFSNPSAVVAAMIKGAQKNDYMEVEKYCDPKTAGTGKPGTICGAPGPDRQKMMKELAGARLIGDVNIMGEVANVPIALDASGSKKKSVRLFLVKKRWYVESIDKFMLNQQ